jgi:hypothetical protein
MPRLAAIIRCSGEKLRSNRVLAYIDDFHQRLTPYQGAKPARDFMDYLTDRLSRDSQLRPVSAQASTLAHPAQSARQCRGALSSRRSATLLRNSA